MDKLSQNYDVLGGYGNWDDEPLTNGKENEDESNNVRCTKVDEPSTRDLQE